MTNTIKIEGMHCEKCVERVTASLKQVKGVTDVKVSLADKCAVVTGEANVDELVEAVTGIGFEVV